MVVLEGVEALPEVSDTPGASIELISNTSPIDTEKAPRIAGYRLLARFRASAVNAVYLGLKIDPLLHPRRAIVKFVPKSGHRYDERSRMLFDEGLALSALEHPNIVRLLELGESDAGTYLAIELVDGLDLREVARLREAASTRIGLEVALHVMVEVLRAVDHAHNAKNQDGTSLGMVHRDVNPSNILLAKTGHVRLADFGMVKMTDRFQGPTAPGMVKGKFRFLAPEYIEAQMLGPSVDIYGVGVTLFELLTGGPWTTEPNATKVMRRIVEEGLPLSTLERAGVPPEIVGIVSLAIEREPSRRFETAADMLAAIEAWLMQTGAYVSASVLASFVRETLASRRR